MSQIPEVLYPAGTTISSSKPLVYGLNFDCKAKYCDECFKPGTSLKKCSRCRCMFYCDEVCQKLNWKMNHKRDCSPRLARLDQYEQLVSAAFSLVRDPEVVKQKFFLNPLGQEDKDREKVKSFNLQDLPSFPGIAGADSLSPFMEIFRQKIHLNLQIILDVYDIPLGLGLYVAESCATSHSCAPNAVFVFKGVQAYLRAMVDIHVGQPITVCNGLLFCPRIERRQHLFDGFAFHCTCELCTEEWDKDVDYQAFNSQIRSLSLERCPTLLASVGPFLQKRIVSMKQCYLTMLKICKHHHPRLTVHLMNTYFLIKTAQDKWPNLNAPLKEFDDMFPDLRESLIENAKITHDPSHLIWDRINALVKDGSVVPELLDSV